MKGKLHIILKLSSSYVATVYEYGSYSKVEGTLSLYSPGPGRGGPSVKQENSVPEMKGADGG